MNCINETEIGFLKVSAINGRDLLEYAVSKISEKCQISEMEVLKQYVLSQSHTIYGG